MYLKVLNDDGRVYHHPGAFTWPLPTKNEDGTWMPGEWVTVKRPLKRGLTADDLCTARVFHGLRPDQLLDWLGPAIFEMEFGGAVVEGPDKVGGTRARLLRRIEAWNERTARIFACDCAEGALQYADPDDRPTLECVIYVARCYADGEATQAELAAAWDAAWAAARAAAWDAARDAARDAAWAAQGERLLSLLGLADAGEKVGKR